MLYHVRILTQLLQRIAASCWRAAASRPCNAVQCNNKLSVTRCVGEQAIQAAGADITGDHLSVLLNELLHDLFSPCWLDHVDGDFDLAAIHGRMERALQRDEDAAW